MAGRRCATCQLEARAEVEAEILKGTPLHAIERKYGISDESLKFHRDNCILALVSRTKTQSDETRVNGLLDRLEHVQLETRMLYVEQRKKDPALALKCLARMESQIQTAARIMIAMGEIQKEPAEKGNLIAILAAARARLHASRAENEPDTPRPNSTTSVVYPENTTFETEVL
jgi:hypothetical protein